MLMRTLKELMNLRGRVALVTGGGGHIGSAICQTLAELGAKIVILDKVAEACSEAAQSIHNMFGVETMTLVTDLSEQKEVQAVPQKVLDRFGQLDILINCAAFVGSSGLTGWTTPFLKQDVETWRLALEVNLTAAFTLSQAAAEALVSSNNGSIINISSIYGVVGPDMGLYEGTPMGNPAAYAASKGGLVQLTRWLATVLAPAVRVNAITVGGVWRNQPEPFVSRYISRTPLRRMAVEEDLKGVIAFLASDLSAYVTGTNVTVDGGWTAW
jgi:NAD(P)-dependent dehydrogenase (short-subunit alcohol dehydrogenase family)